MGAESREPTMLLGFYSFKTFSYSEDIHDRHRHRPATVPSLFFGTPSPLRP
jgi:hypothetical protein